MRIDIVRIGNSQGVRIPKALLQQAGLTDTAEIRVEEGRIILERPRRPRVGWDEAFAHMHQAGDDGLLWPEHPLSQFDHDEWEW